MNGYLLDTNVVCEPQKATPNARVLAWITKCDPSSLFVSVVTLGEIRRGVEMHRGGVRRRELQAWFERFRTEYADRILAINADIADRWGVLTATNPNLGRRSLDAFIAATAIEAGLIVVTRNTRDFIPFGVNVVDPWE